MAVTSENLFNDLNKTLVGKSSSIDKKGKSKKEIILYKYSKGTSLAEAIFINNNPMFLQIQNGKAVLSETIDLDDQIIIVPPDKSSYLSKEYTFSSNEEIEHYIKRVKNETLNSIYKKEKNVWKKIF
jgi:hypothetical protein